MLVLYLENDEKEQDICQHNLQVKVTMLSAIKYIQNMLWFHHDLGLIAHFLLYNIFVPLKHAF